MNNYREIMDRLKLFFKVKSDKKVAEKLGINYNTVKTWSNRGKIPLEKILDRLKNETLNIDWLLTGRGEMFLKDEEKIIGINNSVVGQVGHIVTGTVNQQNINNANNFSSSSQNQQNENKIHELIENFQQLPQELQDYYLNLIKAEVAKYQYEQKKFQNQGKI